MPETVVIKMADIVSNIGSVVTESLSWVGEVATTVAGNDLLLFGLIVGFVPLGISMFKSIFHA